MDQPQIFQRTLDFVKKYYSDDDTHGFPHVMRVLKIAEVLSKSENCNSFIVKISTLLHDIGRLSEGINYDNNLFLNLKKDVNHAEISAQIAEKYLRQYINLESSIISRIIHCIRAHSFSNKIEPQTIEAKILSDADKLDAIGAIGIYRTIAYQIDHGTGVNGVLKHLQEKILKLNEQLYLKKSKEMALEKKKIVDLFNSKLKEELL